MSAIDTGDLIDIELLLSECIPSWNTVTIRCMDGTLKYELHLTNTRKAIIEEVKKVFQKQKDDIEEIDESEEKDFSPQVKLKKVLKYNKEDIQKALSTHVRKFSQGQAETILKAHNNGSKKLKDLPEKNYNALMKALTKKETKNE